MDKMRCMKQVRVYVFYNPAFNYNTPEFFNAIYKKCMEIPLRKSVFDQSKRYSSNYNQLLYK